MANEAEMRGWNAAVEGILVLLVTVPTSTRNVTIAPRDPDAVLCDVRALVEKLRGSEHHLKIAMALPAMRASPVA